MRPARSRLLLILHAWVLLAVIPFTYAAPADAFSILRICDDTDEDGVIGIRVEHDRAAQCAGRTPDEVASESRRAADTGADARASVLARCVVRLRAPPTA